MTIVHPIDRAWLSAGGTGAQNYDEFADDAEITAIVAANPRSALAVEMPHRAPGSPAGTVAQALPAAADRLARAQRDGWYVPARQVVVLYRISAPGTDAAAYGMFCMVDTDQISASSDEPGLVIRNEDVFLEKVRERVALAEATGHLLSPVLLLQTSDGGGGGNGRHGRLQPALVSACRSAGEPAVTDVDPAGRTHEIWPLPPGPLAEELCELAGAGELVVADGNHRSLAAQVAGLPRFLAVVTTPDSVTIQPYNRLVAELPFRAADLADRLTAAGAGVARLPARPQVPASGGAVQLYGGGAGYAVTLPERPGGDRVENLDHALVERVLLGEALGLDPGDKRITYVGGDYPAGWLCDEVDTGRAELAVLIAPVTVEDFVAVNLARQKMPRKSTWFTPKARAGLVLAQLH